MKKNYKNPWNDLRKISLARPQIEVGLLPLRYVRDERIHNRVCTRNEFREGGQESINFVLTVSVIEGGLKHVQHNRYAPPRNFLFLLQTEIVLVVVIHSDAEKIQ